MRKLLLLLPLLASCTDNDAATRTLESSGFTEIQLTGYEPFKCAESTATWFTASNALGKHVHGVVCCGFALSARGCTVRF